MSTNGIEGCWAYVPVRQAPAKMDMDRIFFHASMIIHVFIIKIQHLDRHIVGACAGLSGLISIACR